MRPDEWFESLVGRAAAPHVWPKLVRALASRVAANGRIDQIGAVRLYR